MWAEDAWRWGNSTHGQLQGAVLCREAQLGSSECGRVSTGCRVSSAQVLEASLGGQLPSELGKEAWHSEETAPDLRPGVPGRVRAWREAAGAQPALGAKANSLLPTLPHPHRQLQKVGRAPASMRPGELPAPNQAADQRGLDPTRHLEPRAYTPQLSFQPSVQLRDDTAQPEQSGRCR